MKRTLQQDVDWVYIIEEHKEVLISGKLTSVRGSITLFPRRMPVYRRSPENAWGVIGYEAFPSLGRARLTILVIIPQARGQGFGMKLVEFAERRLKIYDITEVAGTRMLEEAEGFWEKMGYTVTGDIIRKKL